MRPRRPSKVATDSPSRQLVSFIGKFDPKAYSRCRAEMRRLLQTAIELVYDNYNFFVIGYSPTERASDSFFSIAATANGVGLAFLQGPTLPNPKKLRQGAGKKNRFVRLATLATLKSQDVRELIHVALRQAKAPLLPHWRILYDHQVSFSQAGARAARLNGA